MTTLPKWADKPIKGRDDGAVLVAAMKYAHLIGLAIASKFFMLLSGVFLLASFSNKAYHSAAIISGSLWALCLLLTMIYCFKEARKIVRERKTSC